ncbi:hypothetical protein K0O23_13415 [Pontibacter aydingkolensis]|uniref:Uncharacterized protein n=2 Tax=Pontibacter aydingkolensis TaxID=1911536 RepID=A0ABS7CW27_9BACT|nr:hypothetical protein [Pontibacter aydingkolensis]
MENRLDIWSISGWLFGIVMLIVGLLNMFLVHLVPGIAYLLLSLIYLPPANAYFRKKTGFPIPLAVKLILGVAIFFFTLGVSDLGDMIDKL